MLGGTGRTLITAGTLLLLFVAYQLWGTGLQEAKSQRSLGRDFNAVLEADAATVASSSTTAPTTTTVTQPGSTTTTAMEISPTSAASSDIPLPNNGDPIALIKIPKIGLTRTVVEGVGVDDLKRGPGHYPETPLPGQAGNASIAGHRTTYGQPFHNVDRLGDGDQILVTTRQGTFVYRVDSVKVVSPGQSEVLLPTRDPAGNLENRITLTACHPKYSAKQRLVISGLLAGKPRPALVGQPEAQKKAVAERSTQKARTQGDVPTLDGGLSGVKQSKTPAIAWGLVCALIWLATWLVQTLLRRSVRRRASETGGRRLRGGKGGSMATGLSRGQRSLTWSPYVVGLPLFLVALYVFFENFARLLPGNF